MGHTSGALRSFKDGKELMIYAGDFLTSCNTVSFSRTRLLHVIRWLWGVILRDMHKALMTTKAPPSIV